MQRHRKTTWEYRKARYCLLSFCLSPERSPRWITHRSEVGDGKYDCSSHSLTAAVFHEGMASCTPLADSRSHRSSRVTCLAHGVTTAVAKQFARDAARIQPCMCTPVLRRCAYSSRAARVLCRGEAWAPRAPRGRQEFAYGARPWAACRRSPPHTGNCASAAADRQTRDHVADCGYVMFELSEALRWKVASSDATRLIGRRRRSPISHPGGITFCAALAFVDKKRADNLAVLFAIVCFD